MYDINTAKISVITTAFVTALNVKSCEASCIIYVLTDGGGSSIYAKQFICKTKDEINYNIFIINTKNSDVTSVKLLDILPKGANVSDIKSVTLEGKTPIDYTIKNNSIEFSINPTIKAHLYSRVVVTIKNNTDIDIESNNAQIEEVT